MPKVSVIIPTCNRPELLARAIHTVLLQTYQDFEIIVVDDGDNNSAKATIAALHDARITYIAHDVPRRGGSATRNTGIKNAKTEFIAFCDDDDEWLPEKLAVQMEQFANTGVDVGFCFTAARIETDEFTKITPAKEGINDFSMIALLRFKGFLTTTLIVKRAVFDDVGLFDESLPSHQEAELIIRITRKYKGLGINIPLVVMNMHAHEHIGSDLSRRIRGKELVLEKHKTLYSAYPRALAKQYFWLALWCRDAGQHSLARKYFWNALALSGSSRHLLHWLLSITCHRVR